LNASDIEHVRDILECIEAIDRAEVTVQRYGGDFDVAWVALDAVQFRVVTIADAVESLSLDLREDHPAVAWSDMARLRDLIGPPYDNLDPNTVRVSIGELVRALGSVCRAILAESVRVGEDEP